MSSSNDKVFTETLEKVESKYVADCAKSDPGVRPRFRMSCRPIAPCIAQEAHRRARRQATSKKKKAQADLKPAGKGEDKSKKAKANAKAVAAKGAKGPENAGPNKLED